MEWVRVTHASTVFLEEPQRQANDALRRALDKLRVKMTFLSSLVDDEKWNRRENEERQVLCLDGAT